MYSPKSPYTQIALDAITRQLGVGITHPEPSPEIPAEIFTIRKGCFVSLHLKNGELRGCVGTIYPQENNLFEEIKRNAISAAFRDGRFKPLTINELDELEISVDILTLPEAVYAEDDLDPSIYGVIVSDDKHNRAVLLPGIGGIETIEQQMHIVKRKAGICQQVPWQELQVQRFTSNRYR